MAARVISENVTMQSYMFIRLFLELGAGSYKNGFPEDSMFGDVPV